VYFALVPRGKTDAMRTQIIAVLLKGTPPLALMAAGLSTAAHGQTTDRRIEFAIAPASLSTALAQYAQQAKVELIYTPALASGRKSPGVKGQLSALDALSRLLAGTGIVVHQLDREVFMLNDAQGEGSDISEGRSASPAAQSSQEIVVTGTHIHGAPPTAAPTKVVTRSDIERGGYGSVAQALQAMPGNFGGMGTEQSALSYADRSGNNATLASGVNLRGLGPQATLVLVNGRRVAGSGLLGDFADISAIPMSALDRVEIITDGASALYGSDAVAGVVNIILNEDFDGLETRVRGGSVTDGHARELQLAQTAGKSWSNGSILLSYEYQRRVALRSADRTYARSADSTPLGGTDRRYPYASPGNIMGFDQSGALVPTYAIPVGQDGTNLTADDFLAGQTNLDNFREGTDLSPDQKRHSLYARASQAVTDAIKLSLEGRFSHRRFSSLTSGYATILSVTDANPWFVSPTGASSDYIGYSFTKEMGPVRSAGSARSFAFTGGVDAELGSDWKLTGYVAYAAQRDRNRTDQMPNEYLLAEALGAMADDPASAYSPARDGYFNPYGDGNANSPALLKAISGYSAFESRSNILTADMVADGSLFSVPAGAVKLAVGTNFRRERFHSQSTDYIFTATPVAGAPADYSRNIWAGFAELALPLFGPDNARPGFQQLDLSAAVRAEHYGDFGSTANPKFSVRWVPVNGLALRATWGTSFRAPNLRELGAPETARFRIATNESGNSVVVIQRSGGNTSLSPEKAKSWTVGLDLSPTSLAGLTASLTAFRTIFSGRISNVVQQNFSSALTDNAYAPFVRRVSTGTNSEDLAFVQNLLARSGVSSPYPLESIAAVVDARYVNTGRVDVAGGDFDLNYVFERGAHRFNIGLGATYLERWREQVTPTSQGIDRRNIAGRPVDFKGRMTLGWTRGPFDTQFALNHVDAYRDESGSRIKSWNTLDMRMAYKPKGGEGVASGLTIALVAQNLFDKAPPFYDSTAGAGYDGANADATGRFVALEIAKRW
jgi:iron complex outermembrane recepter protein